MVKTFNFKTFIINLLRRGTYRYPPRNEAQKSARVSRGLYLCASCKSVVPKKDTKIDHVNPVVDPKTGFIDWETYITRMFPDKEGFQILCTTCHESKTLTEREQRKIYRKMNKILDKKKEV